MGEEPYSLAILMDKLLPHCDDWNILILGTDLNSEAIAKARRGVYRSWSFHSPGSGNHLSLTPGRSANTLPP
jgi:chemotaxis protein methyltransferase CheR